MRRAAGKFSWFQFVSLLLQIRLRQASLFLGAVCSWSWASRFRKECNPSSLFKCCRDVDVDYMIANDIHELNQELESIRSESTLLHLKPAAEDQIRLDHDVAPDLEPDIVGREVEKDCDSLIQLLKRDYITTCPLFAIIGTIGVRKTTLA